MPEFLGEARTYSDELHILTASPKIIRRSIFRTLRKNNIKFDSVSFKNPFRRESKTNYKVRKITEILEDSMDKFILIGDDVDGDPEVFSKILELYPERILASYIHVIRNREIPSGSIAYWTSADLAIREYLAGRMSQESTEVVLNSLIDVPNLNKVIPDFAHCPRESAIWEWQIQTMFSGKVSIIINRLMEYCNPSKIVPPLISQI